MHQPKGTEMRAHRRTRRCDDEPDAAGTWRPEPGVKVLGGDSANMDDCSQAFSLAACVTFTSPEAPGATITVSFYAVDMGDTRPLETEYETGFRYDYRDAAKPWWTYTGYGSDSRDAFSSGQTDDRSRAAAHEVASTGGRAFMDRHPDIFDWWGTAW